MKPRKVKAKIVFNLQETPHWRIVLPADIASYDLMVEQVVRAADKAAGALGCGNYWNIDCARAALKAIGITKPKERKK